MTIFNRKDGFLRSDIIIDLKKNGDFEFSYCIYGGSPSGDYDDPNDYESFIFIKEEDRPKLYEKLAEQNNLSDEFLNKFIEEHSGAFSFLPDEDKKYFAMIWIHYGNEDGIYYFGEFLRRNRIEYDSTVWG
jgi:hypothetical protein